jgi:small conductance mechanosensitive channel
MKTIIIEFIKLHAWDIIWIIALFLFGKTALRLIVRKVIKLAEDGDDSFDSLKEKKAKTLGGIILNIGNVVIYLFILLMILSLFGVDIRPILAGIGIGGLALGFGAQSLVKDMVAGLFILIESQYNVGDRIKVKDAEGKVVKITMRSTVIQDDDGHIHFVSNGTINNAINLSKRKK